MTRLYSQYRSRIGVISIAILLAFAVLLGQYFRLQVLNHSEYKQVAQKMVAGWENLIAQRGNILDCNGNELTKNVAYYTFWVNPGKIENKEEIAALFRDTFGKDSNYYLRRMKGNTHYSVLEQDVCERECLHILQRQSQLPGLFSDRLVHRYYPYHEMAAQVLGYTVRVFDDSTRLYDRFEGSCGLERLCDAQLSGDRGRFRIQREGSGRAFRSLHEDIPDLQQGMDLHLTMDINLQTILQYELQCALEETEAVSANGILVDPFSGAILAMATVPSFDLNDYSSYPLSTYENKPVSWAYEPGSTVKTVTISAALHEAGISSQRMYNCENGKYRYCNRTIHDYKEYDWLSVAEILIHSSNIGIAKLAVELGPEVLYRYTVNYGFGTPTGITLPGESPGKIFSFDQWDEHSIPSVAMGHEMSATTLQTAMLYCALANGGYLMRPYIIEAMYSHEGYVHEIHPEVLRQVVPENIAIQIMEMLEEVVESGTGQNAQLPGYRIAGKTGTAQIFKDGAYSQGEFVSSFAAVFPAQAPQYVCVVAVEAPKYGYHWGNMAAAPVVRRVFQQIINMSDELPRFLEEDVKIAALRADHLAPRMKERN